MNTRIRHAPEWVMWLACNSGDIWRWFEHEPIAQKTSCFRFTGTGCIDEATGITENEPYLGWKYSKERRPDRHRGVNHG